MNGIIKAVTIIGAALGAVAMATSCEKPELDIHMTDKLYGYNGSKPWPYDENVKSNFENFPHLLSQFNEWVKNNLSPALITNEIYGHGNMEITRPIDKVDAQGAAALVKAFPEAAEWYARHFSSIVVAS